jgi:hypothetical protein
MPAPEEGEFKATPIVRTPHGAPRTAKQVIDQAIRDNKISEWLLYAYASLFVAGGITAILWGMIIGEGIVSLAGSIAGILFYPAIRQAREIRRENIAIRLLEVPLSLSHSTQEAADALREFFLSTLVKRSPKD